MNDVAVLRESAQDALSRGDQSAANEAYRAELAALQGAQEPPQGTHEFPGELAPEGQEGTVNLDAPSDAVEKAYSAMSRDLGWDSEQIAMVQAEWGNHPSDVVANAMLGQAFVEDHPDLIDLAERVGLGNHPGGLVMAAKAARLLGYTYNPPGQQASPQQQIIPRREATTMSDTALTQFEDELQSIRDQIVEAQRSGNSKRANRLFAQEQAMIANRVGNRQIVDGRRTA